MQVTKHAIEVSILALKPRADVRSQKQHHSGHTKRTDVLQKFSKQDSIPVGCIPPTCDDCTCFNSHQMSAPWVGGPVVNNFEQVSSDGHQMSPAEHGGSLCREDPCPGGPVQ